MMKKILLLLWVLAIYYSPISFAEQTDVIFTATFTQSPCEISTESQNKTVKLANTELRNFPEIGSVADLTPFSIDLICPKGIDTLKIQLTGTPYAEDVSVLQNDDQTGALGIGIQVLQSNQQAFDFTSTAEEEFTVIEGSNTLNLFAQYKSVRNKSELAAGTVSSVMDFTIVYP